MAQIVYSAAALADFESIIELALRVTPDAAAGISRRVRSAIEILAAHPLIGRRVDGEIRELVISQGSTGCIALYRFDPVHDVVRVLRIRHQREAGYRP